MRLMVPVGPESGFRERAIRPWSMSKSSIAFYLGSAAEWGFWAVDGMMVQVSGFRLVADRESA
jgi:hypothetical protein